MIVKFQELFDVSEFKRAETILSSASNKFQTKFSHFAFNFGILCLLQDEVEKAALVFEQIIAHEYDDVNAKEHRRLP